MSYRADIPAAEAWDKMTGERDAVLIDVRTDAEWRYVGTPVADRVELISWQVFPSNAVNPDFLAAVEALDLDADQPIYMLCRSGARSAAAGTLLAERGYSNVFNISDGFEGDKDADGHRGTVNGWKHAGLPWRQG